MIICLTKHKRTDSWLGRFYFVHSSCKRVFQPNDMSRDCTNWHLQISKGCLPPRETVGFTVGCWLSSAFLIPFPWKLTLARWGEREVMGCVLISLLQIRSLNLLPSLHPSEPGFPGNGIRDATPQLLTAGTLPLLITEDSTEGASQRVLGLAERAEGRNWKWPKTS